MIKVIGLFIASVIIAALLTSFVSTQIILSELDDFGIYVTLIDRIVATANDLIALGTTLAVLIAPSYLFGFTIAKYAHQFTGGNRRLWYAAAGFSSFPATLYLIKYFMGVTLLASARTSWGMFLAGLCCMLAGWFFATFTKVSSLKENPNANSSKN